MPEVRVKTGLDHVVRFANRHEAGRVLAESLSHYALREDVIVLGLPRGGVPVAYEVARRLRAPLDVFVVRKLGVPNYEELAMGAIASGGTRFLNESVLAQLEDGEEALARATERETLELERREIEYRGSRPREELCGKTVILVDDGLATGSTMHAAVQALRAQGVAKTIVAVPVAPPDVCAEFRSEVDELICVLMPWDFRAVGRFYDDFSQISDEEVRELLARGVERRD
jgi:putative phosphoribosyl transferase